MHFSFIAFIFVMNRSNAERFLKTNVLLSIFVHTDKT